MAIINTPDASWDFLQYKENNITVLTNRNNGFDFFIAPPFYSEYPIIKLTASNFNSKFTINTIRNSPILIDESQASGYNVTSIVGGDIDGEFPLYKN